MKKKEKIFEENYKQFKNQIFLFVLARVSSREDALDITAETFLSAWENLESFRGDSNYKTWIFAICRHKINDYFRKLYKYNDIFNEEIELDNIGDTQTNTDEDNELINSFTFENLMGKLKNIEKELILLKYMNNLNFAECAQVLNISESNARVLHHRTLSKLRKFNN